MYYEDESNRGTNFVAGLVVGTLLGVGMAILMAPQSGKRTRKDLRKALKGARIGSTRLSDLPDEVREAVTAGRRRMRV